MEHYRRPKPGQRCSFKKILFYNQHISSQGNILPCQYTENLTDDRFSFNTNYGNISKNMRISQLVNIPSLGGKIHYGNFYLNQPIELNYLGRTQGQPGGSGAPLRNSF